MNSNIKKLLPVIPALIVFAYLANSLNFIQDDAYITYRYVANYLNGDGLVFNIGERIEGFTNFGWTVLLIMGGSIGINLITFSKIFGYLFGFGIILLTWRIATLIFTERWPMFAYLAVYLVGINISLAYWAPAGLETAAFAFMAMLSVYFYLKRSWLLIWTLALAVWIRPEGAVVTGILIVLELIETRKIPKYTIKAALAALLLSLPYVGFKLFYYGSILPNPFYAKTGFTLTQLANGWEYTARFFHHYGFWGVGLLVPFIFYKKLNRISRSLLFFFILYALYILLVGGDVLKVHRFYLPVMGLSAILIGLSLKLLSDLSSKWINPKNATLIAFLISLGLFYTTYQLPHDFVTNFNFREIRFTKKMQKLALKLLETDSSNFSVAVPTIGIFGYTLLGHDIIDMVGLTDSTIARHSEDPIEGMETTWKEQKHNTAYLLTRAPDYISFSTGIKPSAPAERALYLYRGFVESYKTIGWYFKIEETDIAGLVFAVWKKRVQPQPPFEPYYSVQSIQYYKEGLDNYVSGKYPIAIDFIDRAIRTSRKPYNPYFIYNKAFCHMMLSNHQVAINLMNSVLVLDSTVFEAHRDLYLYARLSADENKAQIHMTWLEKLVPWYVPNVKAYVEEQVRSYRNAGGG